jgi:HlyD family secretion protein
MTVVWVRRLILTGIIATVLVALVLAFRPQPVRVDVESVELGRLEVAIRDDGMTRLRERYIVSTPLAGRLQRVTLEAGDPVTAGETVVARLTPAAPKFLDPRELAQAQAKVKAAEGRLHRAEADLRRTKDDLQQAKNDVERSRLLFKSGATTDAQLEQMELAYRSKSEGLKSAEFNTEIAQFELEQEQTALLHVSAEAEGKTDAGDYAILSPISGKVLRVLQESAAVLAVGAPLMELGDPSDLEAVVDVLSSDAVRIRSGQRVVFEHWGGREPLAGAVRLVEPSGFTKISALGVEEQRVNVVIDFTESLGKRAALGDNYRVEANIIVWEDDQTVSVPTGALFRQGSDWAVFTVADQKARRKVVQIGENNGLRAQVLSGLAAGERVVVHPSDDVDDGVRLEIRSEIKPHPAPPVQVSQSRSMPPAE